MKIVTKTNPDHPEQHYQVTVFIGRDEALSWTEIAFEISERVRQLQLKERLDRNVQR